MLVGSVAAPPVKCSELPLTPATKPADPVVVPFLPLPDESPSVVPDDSLVLYQTSGATTVTVAFPIGPVEAVARTFALPAATPAIYRPAELTLPGPLVTDHVNVGCVGIALPN